MLGAEDSGPLGSGEAKLGTTPTTDNAATETAVARRRSIFVISGTLRNIFHKLKKPEQIPCQHLPLLKQRLSPEFGEPFVERCKKNLQGWRAGSARLGPKHLVKKQPQDDGPEDDADAHNEQQARPYGPAQIARRGRLSIELDLNPVLQSGGTARDQMVDFAIALFISRARRGIAVSEFIHR